MVTNSNKQSEIIEASPYLDSLQQKLKLGNSKVSLDDLQEVGAGLSNYLFDGFESFSAEGEAEAEQYLIRQKKLFSFHWAKLQLVEHLSRKELGYWQSHFADLSIQFALKLATRVVIKKHASLIKHIDHNFTLPGLFILGMGKLGGNDLNFSSDVDLVAYFDPDQLPVPDALGKSYVCHQVLQALTKILGQQGRSDFIWRVDWRLRPNASATTLAMSTAAASDYYFYRASPWHRLALMKARVVAGDIACGSGFLSSLAPFIWRQNLDFRAFDELSEIKQKINLEHPALRAQRMWREAIDDDITGFNVKLGSGGIREIEFIANALQLVWGGKQAELRTPNTLEALQLLSDRQHLEQTTTQDLMQAYCFLRDLEDAIQILDNQQNHLIPASEDRQRRLLTILGLPSWDDLIETLNTHRRKVSDQFESLFAKQEEQEEVADWPKDLTEVELEIIEGWENGFYQYGVSNQLRSRLRPLSLALSVYLQGVESEQAAKIIRRLHEYFRALPQGEQYFRLLAESPKLLEKIIPPLMYSPPMSHLLKQSPHIIDCFMHQPWSYAKDGFDSDYVTQADSYEEQLERMRRFVNEALYQLYLEFFHGQSSVADLQLALSGLAEHTLGLALNVVTTNMQLPECPIAVLGMGKLGLSKMSPTSDLDLVFLFNSEQHSAELASRFVSRLQTAISTPMREGIVYELDTRLRPSGRSGAPTVSLDSFANHQFQRAHTWEHIALVPARVVAGTSDFAEKIDKVKLEVLGGKRQRAQFNLDAMKMWQRIAENRIESPPFENMFSKLRPGGLMQSEYLAACAILTTNLDVNKKITDFEQLLARAGESHDIEGLAEAIQFWRVQQIWERILGHSKQALSAVPKPFVELLLSQSDVSHVNQLVEKKCDIATRVQKQMTSLIGNIEDSQNTLSEWQETNVNWQN